MHREFGHNWYPNLAPNGNITDWKFLCIINDFRSTQTALNFYSMDNWKEDSNKEGNHSERSNKEVRVSALKNRKSPRSTHMRGHNQGSGSWVSKLTWTLLSWQIQRSTQGNTNSQGNHRESLSKDTGVVPSGTENPPSTHTHGRIQSRFLSNKSVLTRGGQVKGTQGKGRARRSEEEAVSCFSPHLCIKHLRH